MYNIAIGPFISFPQITPDLLVSSCMLDGHLGGCLLPHEDFVGIWSGLYYTFGLIMQSL